MTPASPEELAKNYNHTESGCVIIDRSEIGRLWAYGSNRLDVLQRLSTNDLTGMDLHEHRPTVLTTAVGRIVDLLTVLNLKERALLLTSPGQSKAVQQWMQRFIFFQDNIQLKDATSDLKQFGLYGAKASTIVAQLARVSSDLKPGRAHALDDTVWLLRGAAPAGFGYEIVAPPALEQSLIERALDAGAIQAPSSLHELLRVEAGLPGAGHEIMETFLPLEVGLRHAVSFSKGCYTGQEIIARMDSRGKLAKTLVGLRSSQMLPARATLRATDGSTGVVTSSVNSPRMGWIGLGLLKPAAASLGAEVEVESANNPLFATVTRLPFNALTP